MNLLQGPRSALSLILVGVVVTTAFVAAFEARKLGMFSDKLAGTYSPINWFVSLILLWVVACPMYLYKRHFFGVKNRLTIGIIISLIFVVSSFLMSYQIAERQREVNQHLRKLEEINRELQQFDNVYN